MTIQAHGGYPCCAEFERMQRDLATFGKDTEATENRIIDAEFRATELAAILRRCLDETTVRKLATFELAEFVYNQQGRDASK